VDNFLYELNINKKTNILVVDNFYSRVDN